MLPRGLRKLHMGLHMLRGLASAAKGLRRMLGVLLGAGELHFCDSEKKLTKVLSLSEMEVRPFFFNENDPV